MQAISRVVLFFRAHRKTLAFIRIAVCAALAAMFASPQLAGANNTIVRMEISVGSTPAGIIDIELYDDQAPITVANFLRYAGRRDYTSGGFIHRSVPGFIIQGGGFVSAEVFGTTVYFHVPKDPPVQNEFSPSRSNVRGTIAMAKVGGNPDSATSEWFFNLADNSGNLDSQNGGFTVFGRVLASGMSVVDAIANLPILDARAATSQSALGELPVTNFDPASGLKTSNLVMIKRIPNIAAARAAGDIWAIFTTDVDMVLGSLSTVNLNVAATYISSFKPPLNSTVHFNNNMFTFSLSGQAGPPGRIVTMLDGASVRPTHYYAYGPTPNDPSPHWYDFAFDGETGAEIKSDRIILHFVDGKRGDEDRTTNGSITHTGAPAVVTDTTTSSPQSGGCSIASTPSQTMRGSDWIIVSLFLVFLAVTRKRARHKQF